MSEKHVCVIGAGRHSTANLYPVLLSLGDVVIDAVCIRHLEVAQETAGKCGRQTRAYDSIDEMLEKETCGTVIICVPGVVSAATASKCLEKGWNVFCEKPLGMSLQEACYIDDICERSGTFYMTAYMKKFAPVYRSIREAVDKQTYGSVLSYRGAFNVDASRFCKTDRDFMYFVAIHFLALVRFLFGKPERITVVCNPKEAAGAITSCYSIPATSSARSNSKTEVPGPKSTRAWT